MNEVSKLAGKLIKEIFTRAGDVLEDLTVHFLETTVNDFINSKIKQDDRDGNTDNVASGSSGSPDGNNHRDVDSPKLVEKKIEEDNQ